MLKDYVPGERFPPPRLDILETIVRVMSNVYMVTRDVFSCSGSDRGILGRAREAGQRRCRRYIKAVIEQN